MKVLMVAPYLYNARLKAFTKNRTGFGILLDQMLKNIGDITDVYLFSNVITPQIEHYNATILTHTWWDIFTSMSCRDLVVGIQSAIKSKQRIRDRLLYIYYRINCGALRKAIKHIEPDVIHCHGVGEKYMYYIETCAASGIPVINTLHGLIGLSEAVKAYPEDKKAEVEYLKYAERNSMHTTVISSGILSRIHREYRIGNTRCITVIPNGTNISAKECRIDIREKYRIPRDNRILVAVGSVDRRKNQMQIVRSFKLLPPQIQKKLTVLLLGTIADDYGIEAEISSRGLNDEVICCGFVDSNLVSSYYCHADLNVLASIDEGFGLSMIEGFVYGVPCVTFSDLDAVPDIFDERAMLLCSERTDAAFAAAIMSALEKQWDRYWIRKYSQDFSLEQMAKQYLGLYEEIVKKHEQEVSA